MIEGLHFDVSYEEMRTHLEKKALFHEARVGEYRPVIKQMEGMREEYDKAVSGGDDIDRIKAKQATHERKTDLFQFMHDHLVVGETYRLSESDLVSLEFLSHHARW